MALGAKTPSYGHSSPSRSRRRGPVLKGRSPNFLSRTGRALLALLSVTSLGTTVAQSPVGLWQHGDFAAAYEAAAGSGADAELQLLAARAAADQAVYVLARPGAPLEEQMVWLQRSVAAAERAVELDPTSARAVVYLARGRGEIARRSGVLQNLGVATELKRLFDRALQLDPHDPDALVGLGMWHLELVEQGVGWLYGGKRDEVIPLIEAGVEAAPHQVNLRVEFATALRALGYPERAREELETALALPALTAVDRAEQERARELLRD